MLNFNLKDLPQLILIRKTNLKKLLDELENNNIIRQIGSNAYLLYNFSNPLIIILRDDTASVVLDARH